MFYLHCLVNYSTQHYDWLICLCNISLHYTECQVFSYMLFICMAKINYIYVCVYINIKACYNRSYERQLCTELKKWCIIILIPAITLYTLFFLRMVMPERFLFLKTNAHKIPGIFFTIYPVQSEASKDKCDLL